MYASSRDRQLLVLVGILVVLVVACSRTQETTEAALQPDVLLVTIDTLRADHLGCYGYSRPTSPNLDRMAAEGARFEVAYAPVGATCPSHATLFTARLPTSHGLVRNGLELRGEETVLAEFLRDAGYQTAGFVSSYPLKGELGFAQGFDHYDDSFPAAEQQKNRKKRRNEKVDVETRQWEGVDVSGGFSRPAEATASALIEWLEGAEPRRPVFVWLHLFDPHAPYAAPPPFRGRFNTGEQRDRVALYDEEILHADSQIGRVVDAMTDLRGARERLVVATSDHGEGLLDHGRAGHNWSTFEEEVRIPLIFHWPGRIPAGRTLAQPAQLADLPPTIASLLGLSWPGVGDQGVDLAAHILTDTRPDLERTLYLHRPFYPDGRSTRFPDEKGWGLALRRGRWKYFEALAERRRELYDLELDPRETTNLYEQRPEIAATFASSLERWHQELTENSASLKARVAPEVQEALRALGYLADEEPAETEDAQ